MKKHIIFLSLFILVSIVLSAQGLFDVSKYSNTGIMGTARYMSMAGSMGALGGDPSAIIDNPAALGIYRSSELSFTLNATPNVTRANSATINSKANDFFFNFNHLSYAFSIPTGRNKGYVSSNFSFTYNRLKDFHRSIAVGDMNTNSYTNMMADLSNGFGPSALVVDNIYAPYLSVLGYEGYLFNPMSETDTMNYLSYADKTEQMRYKAVESGRIDEYNFTYSANVGHYLYIGASLGMQTLDYRLRSSSGESYNNGAAAILSNDFRTSGIGWLLRLGVIVRPVSFMRIGLSFQTPVWYTMTDYYSAEAKGIGTSAEFPEVEFKTPDSRSNYYFDSPLKAQLSLGFVIGKSALINVDYQFTHNKGAKLKSNASDDLFSEPEFAFDNDEIKEHSLESHLIKIGAEYRVASQFSIRAGFAYRTPNISSNATKTILDNTTRTDMELFVDKGSIYAAGGLGYRYNGFGIDLTYAFDRNLQSFSPYQIGSQLLTDEYGNTNGYFGVPNKGIQKHLASIATMKHNIVLSLSYKF